jgi:hypothetical protein
VKGTLGPALPAVRAARLAARYRGAVLRARLGSARPAPAQPVFIIGCGRSGTTLLGELLAKHPGARYLYEPYHLWAAVDPRTDMIHLHQRCPAACVMGAADADAVVRRRFNTLFGAGDGRRLIEKTPINTLRIGYLEAIAPGCRFVHIVRSGVDVARSIERLATTNGHRIFGRARFNQWWGENDVKWRLLQRDGGALGRHPAAALGLDSHAARGAYEWLLSLHEVDRRRAALGDRALEVRLDDLIAAPEAWLAQIAAHCGLDASDGWLRACMSMLDESCVERGGEIELPRPIVDDFNAFQRRYGYRGRAVAPEAPVSPPASAATA